MEIYNQVKNQFGKSQNIFILLPKEVRGDNLGAALALFYTLEKLNKNVNLFLENLPEKLKFLPLPDYLNSLKTTKKFIISLPNLGEDVSEISFNKEGRDLKIQFFTKSQDFTEKDIPLISQNLEPDLLISVGAKNLDNLGNFFKESPQFFYEKPILNIGADISVENFGEVNLIEKDSSGVSEIIGELLKEIYPELIDEEIATSLLAGIMLSTQNFQNQKTSPKNLMLASYLIEKGARHQEISHSLFGIESFCPLKLFGRVLEKLNFNQEKKIYSVSLNRRDFQETGTSPKNLSNVLAELKLLNPDSLLMLWESHGSDKLTRGVFYSQNKDFHQKILKNYEGTQKDNGVLFLVRNPAIEEAEKEVLGLL